MKINDLGLWEDFTDKESDEMLRVATNMIQKGEYPSPVPVWIKLYFSHFGYDERQHTLLMMSEVPSRALLSIIHRQTKN